MYKSKTGWATHVNEPFFVDSEGSMRSNFSVLKKIHRNTKTKSSILVHGKNQWTYLSDWNCIHILEACSKSPHLCYLLTNDTAAIPEIVRLWQIQYMASEWPANVWLGFTVTDQKSFDKNWQAFTDEADGVLGRFPDVNVFVQYAAVGALVLPRSFYPNMLTATTQKTEWGESGLKWHGRWLIAGGEKGKNARPPHPKWLSDIKNQCLDNGIMFYFDGWGKWIIKQNEPIDNFRDTAVSIWDGHKLVNGARRKDNGLLFGKAYKETPLGAGK